MATLSFQIVCPLKDAVGVKSGDQSGLDEELGFAAEFLDGLVFSCVSLLSLIFFFFFNNATGRGGTGTYIIEAFF